ncbi:MAG: isoamylase early set domain-containing protein [Candidatus Scalindua sp.]|nr:isoamylase early set domain-containing protein [Candidatus Scalindua sp.]
MVKNLEKSGTNLEKGIIEKDNLSKNCVKAESQPVKDRTRNGGIKKEYVNDKNLCRVTFTLPKEATNGSESVSLVGDFNNWDSRANPMEKGKDGGFVTVCDLEPGREFQFRYLIDDSIWENDWCADRYVKSCYGDSDNSVVIT